MQPLQVLEQAAGALVTAVVLVDLFLTVLYARIGAGIISTRVARGMWHVFRGAARRVPSRRGKLLSFCGPLILVALVLVWGIGLAVGSAMVLQPHLGTTLTSSSGKSGRDFVTAMFAGGSSIAVVGAGSYSPQSGPLKMFYLFNSLLGMSGLSLTLTYLMQIYSALQQRNSVALSLEISSGRNGDAANFLAGLGPQGQFQTGYSTLSNLGDNIAKLKEAHHFYPVLFYFRFEEPYYAVSRITNVALDTATLIRTVLDDTQYRWLRNSGAVEDLWQASMLLLVTLERTFLEGEGRPCEPPDLETRERWRERFFGAAATLQAAQVPLASDLQRAADAYVTLPSQWSGHIQNLAPSMLYTLDEIDPPRTFRAPHDQSARQSVNVPMPR